MSHPFNRAERRHQRSRVIAARRFINLHIWCYRNPEEREETRTRIAWGKYAKWNLNCGSPRCHYLKYFSEKRKRREALKHSGESE